MLALVDAPVVEVPQLGPLVLGVPLAELVAEGEDPLLRPGPLLVAAGAAEGGVEAVLGDRVQQRHRLQAVARGPRTGLLDHAAAVDRVLDAGHDQPLAQFGHPAVAVLDHLGEVVAGVHVHQREREGARPEGLLGQAQQHDRVLAAAEQQHRALEFGGDLAHHLDRLGLERAQVGQLGAGGVVHSCSPHSVLSVPAQRPSRPLPGWVQGAHPIEA